MVYLLKIGVCKGVEIYPFIFLPSNTLIDEFIKEIYYVKIKKI